MFNKHTNSIDERTHLQVLLEDLKIVHSLIAYHKRLIDDSGYFDREVNMLQKKILELQLELVWLEEHRLNASSELEKLWAQEGRIQEDIQAERQKQAQRRVQIEEARLRKHGKDTTAFVKETINLADAMKWCALNGFVSLISSGDVEGVKEAYKNRSQQCV